METMNNPEGRPISEVIRERIQRAGKPFHANDNISEFIHSDEERRALPREVESKVADMLRRLDHGRPQIQEEAVMTLADELEARIAPDGLAVVMKADHFCMHWRGYKWGVMARRLRDDCRKARRAGHHGGAAAYRR